MCFWTMPASTSGKYHPAHSLGQGGLIRHTRAVVLFAVRVFLLGLVLGFLLGLHEQVEHLFEGEVLDRIEAALSQRGYLIPGV